MKTHPNLIRGKDDILVWRPQPGAYMPYKDPGEAVKTFHNGVYRLSCAERRFSHHQSSPCGKPAKFDPDANGNMTRCGLHSAARRASVIARQEARDQARHAKNDLKWQIIAARNRLEDVLRQIAKGHNDPRGIATEAITNLDALRKQVTQDT